jgi:hypothetical protein
MARFAAAPGEDAEIFPRQFSALSAISAVKSLPLADARGSVRTVIAPYQARGSVPTAQKGGFPPTQSREIPHRQSSALLL